MTRPATRGTSSGPRPIGPAPGLGSRPRVPASGPALARPWPRVPASACPWPGAGPGLGPAPGLGVGPASGWPGLQVRGAAMVVRRRRPANAVGFAACLGRLVAGSPLVRRASARHGSSAAPGLGLALTLASIPASAWPRPRRRSRPRVPAWPWPRRRSPPWPRRRSGRGPGLGPPGRLSRAVQSAALRMSGPRSAARLSTRFLAVRRRPGRPRRGWFPTRVLRTTDGVSRHVQRSARGARCRDRHPVLRAGRRVQPSGAVG